MLLQERLEELLAEHIPLWAASNPHNANYIDTKKKRMGHMDLAQVIKLKDRKTA